MTAIRQRMRRPKATRRFPAAELRALCRDHRAWLKLGLVYEPDNGSHYELVIEDSVLVDILVEVETVPDLIPLTCRLGSCAGGAGRGIWEIPAVDDEVLIAVPDGDIAFMPAIVACLSTGSIPNPTGQGPATDRTIIINGEVLIHDGSGGAVSLATKADVQTIRGELHEHSHIYLQDTTGDKTPTVTTGNPSVTAPAGTTILKAK